MTYVSTACMPVAQVTSARNKLTMCCHPDKACLPGNSFVVKLEGVGALMGDAALQVWPTLLQCTITSDLSGLDSVHNSTCGWRC